MSSSGGSNGNSGGGAQVGGAVQVGGVQVGRGRFSGGRGANGQTLWELKRSKGANVGEGRELMGIFLQFEFNF